MGVDETALTASVVQTYQTNYNLVAGLAQKYGFEFRFFWPPYIGMGKKPLVAEEQAIAHAVDPALDSLYHSVYRMIESGSAQIFEIFGAYGDLR